MLNIENEYKKLCGRIGLTMIFFIVLLSVLSIIGMAVSSIVTPYFNEMGATVFDEIVQIIVYLTAFMLPVGFFHLIYGKVHPRDMFLSISLPGKMTFIYVFGGIAIVLAAAYVNSFIISFFDFGKYSEEVLWATNLDHGYNMVLMFISTAIVPAFCEEFLFRGMVLGNLLPYGKANAIIISAVLFGLMHQNAEQILYTTVAGLVFGYVYVKTKSIWVTTLMHFFNNFISVLKEIIYEKAAVNIAWAVNTLIDCLVMGIGVICIVIILKHLKEKAPVPVENVYIKGFYTDESLPTEQNLELSGRRALKLFFRPTTIVFIVLCILTAILLLVTGMFYNVDAGAKIGLGFR